MVTFNILDMNEAADEVVEVASAVMARLVFDRLRRAEPRNRLPVNLILEEAHRYVAEHPSRYAIDASRIFERIAKEGRKYGMFLNRTSAPRRTGMQEVLTGSEGPANKCIPTAHACRVLASLGRARDCLALAAPCSRVCRAIDRTQSPPPYGCVINWRAPRKRVAYR
jgi:hypothetical protein